MILLFTDFGWSGPYVGQVKAVLAAEAPKAAIIDLMHDAPRCRPRPAAYLLAALVPRLPPAAVLLGVVDPGVGTDRAPVALRIDGRWYVGPDNGLFEPALRRARDCAAWRIDWRPPALSASFHGRDLFAPVAAILDRGGMVPGEPMAVDGLRRPDWPAEVIHLDHYGNATTGWRAAALPGEVAITAAGRSLNPARTFGEVPPGTAFWYENSNGLVEIAVSGGSAAETLGLALGTPIRIEAPGPAQQGDRTTRPGGFQPY